MKICIIKLGALGDVVRTLPVAKAIKDFHKESEITWLTKSDAVEILQNISFISKIHSTPFQTSEKFNLLYNFDIDAEATSLAEKITAEKKFGFCAEGDFPQSFNLGAEYYLNTSFDDEIKKSNTLTYQQMMFKAAEIPYKKELIPLQLLQPVLNYAKNFINQNSIDTKKLVGIHIGASARWPSKTWHTENLKEFLKKSKQRNYEILLFGGADESEKLVQLAEEFHLPHNNPYNSILEFASLVNECKTIVCSDSFALHIALALKKPTIALFFCTPPNEVEGYNLLKKIISPKLYEFFPERMNQYDEQLVKSITADEVLAELKHLLNHL